MDEPRLRTVNKAKPPYRLNDFPNDFIDKLAGDIVYMYSTKQAMSLEGEEWEQIFAHAINAEWHPSNVGLDDVVLGDCCWSAKTVFASSGSIENQAKVRLISGRNSPTYSFGVDKITEAPPDEIGRLVLRIWNERVSGIRQYFKFARTVVLVKAKQFDEYLIFETETIRYDPDAFIFEWNRRGNLEGRYKDSQIHKFTWQPHGSQFTIVEDIPEERVHLRVRLPEKLSKEDVLSTIGFDRNWYTII